MQFGPLHNTCLQALEAEDLDLAESCALRVIQLLPHATLPQVLVRKRAGCASCQEGNIKENLHERSTSMHPFVAGRKESEAEHE
jgi:hypothetical protein